MDAETRQTLKAIKDALDEVLAAARDYIPPDSAVSQKAALNRILAAVDNPQINAARERAATMLGSSGTG